MKLGMGTKGDPRRDSDVEMAILVTVTLGVFASRTAFTVAPTVKRLAATNVGAHSPRT
jgi:hypothetical protein